MNKVITILMLLLCPMPIFAMHIAEGFLPAQWSIFWWVLFIPFLVIGFKQVKKKLEQVPQSKILYAVVAAFVFVLSSLKLPSVTGSSSHLTGIALGALLFGASGMSVIGLIVLLFQALLLAHGGLTTLGANGFSMAVIGAYVAIFIFRCGEKVNLPQWISIFMAAFLSDLCTYICTSIQLGLAFQSETHSFIENTLKFLSIFAISQLPLAIIEGVLTIMFFKIITRYNHHEIQLLKSDK